MTKTVPDMDLIGMIAKAESTAFEYLYRKYYNMVKYFVEQNSGDSEDASDLFQDVLIIIFEKARDQRLELTCSLKTYIYSVARNQWLKKLAARKHQIPLKNFEEFVAVEEDPPGEPLKSVQNMLNEIGEACRKLLVLFYYRKKSMEEISVELNYSNADTVKNQKYKCIQRLKKIAAEKKAWS